MDITVVYLWVSIFWIYWGRILLFYVIRYQHVYLTAIYWYYFLLKFPQSVVMLWPSASIVSRLVSQDITLDNKCFFSSPATPTHDTFWSAVPRWKPHFHNITTSSKCSTVGIYLLCVFFLWLLEYYIFILDSLENTEKYKGKINTTHSCPPGMTAGDTFIRFV